MSPSFHGAAEQGLRSVGGIVYTPPVVAALIAPWGSAPRMRTDLPVPTDCLTATSPGSVTGRFNRCTRLAGNTLAQSWRTCRDSSSTAWQVPRLDKLRASAGPRGRLWPRGHVETAEKGDRERYNEDSPCHHVP
jgi:hypothetical protein